MKRLTALMLLLPTGVMTFVPHQFWNRPKAIRYKLSSSKRELRVACSMYFDDHERLLDMSSFNDGASYGGNNQWISSLSEEKYLALGMLLGYNSKSASNLTDEKIREETLRWAIDTGIVCAGDDDESTTDKYNNDDTNEKFTKVTSNRPDNSRYNYIKDLQLSSCSSTLQCLNFLWNGIADTLELKMSESSSTHTPISSAESSIKLIAFPRSKDLWDYDIMVTMLEAIQLSTPLLPSQFDLHLDLFHPDYKHSPRMWSPKFHSPFPTVGLSVSTKNSQSVDEDEIDLDTMRDRLDVIFFQNSVEDHKLVLKKCQNWLSRVEHQRKKSHKVDPTSMEHFEMKNVDWIIQTGRYPFQLYKTLWNSILSLSSSSTYGVSVVIDPYLDSSKLLRIAVTVNAALKRLGIPVCISQVFGTDSPANHSGSKIRPPYGMIQLSALCNE